MSADTSPLPGGLTPAVSPIQTDECSLARLADATSPGSRGAGSGGTDPVARAAPAAPVPGLSGESKSDLPPLVTRPCSWVKDGTKTFVIGTDASGKEVVYKVEKRLDECLLGFIWLAQEVTREVLSEDGSAPGSTRYVPKPGAPMCVIKRSVKVRAVGRGCRGIRMNSHWRQRVPSAMVASINLEDQRMELRVMQHLCVKSNHPGVCDARGSGSAPS